MTMADGSVSVSRRIEASAERLFALLADSANPPADRRLGHGARAGPGLRLSRAGDAFLMNMHRDEFGDYQMRNEVVDYEAGRRLAWEPARVAASPYEQEATGGPARYRWAHEFSPRRPRCHPGHRDVRLQPFPAGLRHPRRPGRRGWRDAMTASLARLELLAKAAAQRDQ